MVARFLVLIETNMLNCFKILIKISGVHLEVHFLERLENRVAERLPSRVQAFLSL